MKTLPPLKLRARDLPGIVIKDQVLAPCDTRRLPTVFKVACTAARKAGLKPRVVTCLVRSETPQGKRRVEEQRFTVPAWVKAPVVSVTL